MESTLSKNNLVHRIKGYKLKPQVHNLLLFIFLTLLLLSSVIFTYIYTSPKSITPNSDTNLVTNNEGKQEEDTPISSNTTIEEETTPEQTPQTENTQQTTTKSTESKTTTTPTPQAPDTTEPQLPETPSAYVAFYSDPQSDTDTEDQNHQRVVNYILSSGANPVFNAGDLMEDGTQESLNRFNTVTSTIRSTRYFYSALGNNDRVVGDSSTPSSLYLNNFTFPNNEQWYSVNYGNLHMVVLDSAFSASNQTQISWLISDLQSSNSQNKITGVMYHHPTYSNTISSYLINYDVDFVISGHTHGYTHTVSNGINYFVLSGQPSIGYITAKVYSNKVDITAYNSGNGVIETVEINER